MIYILSVKYVKKCTYNTLNIGEYMKNICVSTSFSTENADKGV